MIAAKRAKKRLSGLDVGAEAAVASPAESVDSGVMLTRSPSSEFSLPSSSSSTSGRRGQPRLGSPCCSSASTASVADSETSDYQRSTPSPGDDIFAEENNTVIYKSDSVKSEDLGFVDELKDDVHELGISAKSFYAKRHRRNVVPVSLSQRVAIVSDPKAHYAAQPAIKVRKLQNVTPNMIVSVSEALRRRVSVSPKRKLPAAAGANLAWFAKQQAVPPASPEKSPSKLIRPAVLNVTPTKTAAEAEESTGKFTSAASPPKPFLPPVVKSGYLFGCGDDFERAPDEEIIDLDEEEEDDDEDDDDYEDVDESTPAPTAVSSPTEDKAALPLLPAAASVIPTATPTDTPKLRFPAMHGTNNMIECKWKNCRSSFTTYGKLSDHLKAVHVLGQFSSHPTARLSLSSSSSSAAEVSFECLWSGCKVFAKKSCSRLWLEKHVPTHGGKLAFACIVSGCKMRFTSQKMLQRHVNSHFSDELGDGGASSSRKSASDAHLVSKAAQSESTKNLRRAGVKLKFRPIVFSARIFDFFDAGMMERVKQSVVDVERRAEARLGPNVVGEQAVTLQGRVVCVRTEANGERKALVTYTPKDILDDEWMPLADFRPTRQVSLSVLPERAKADLKASLFAAHAPFNDWVRPTRKSRRKP